MNILFLRTGNSCRPILAEATFNHLAPVSWTAMSAGSQPTGQVRPRSLALLAPEGISAEGCHSKSWDKRPPGELKNHPVRLKIELDRIGMLLS